VTNAGTRQGEEVVQLYVTEIDASVPVPVRALQGFRRISLKPGEKQGVLFVLEPRQISVINSQAKRVVEPGTIDISVGGKQPGFKGVADTHTSGVVSGRVTVTGPQIELAERVNQ
jgi:beta-glucosidase